MLENLKLFKVILGSNIVSGVMLLHYIFGGDKPESSDKHILLWTSDKAPLFRGFDLNFSHVNCPFTNCKITKKKHLHGGDIRRFDAIVFHSIDVLKMKMSELPQKRSAHQKYVFASQEAAEYAPVCRDNFNYFFNLTWTYKVDSDGDLNHITIRDQHNVVVGPSKVMHWRSLKDMDSISKELKQKLQSKTKAAAWFVSNCDTKSGRLEFYDKLQEQLKKYNLEVDIYGKCGKLDCPKSKMGYCLKMLERDYYFYLAFEKSLSPDYVTEILLHALSHNTVPIVLGDNYYDRFMPESAYLNGKQLGAKRLAATMNDVIVHRERYHDFFRWKKYYTYHARPMSKDVDNAYCEFCIMINEDKHKVYKNFRRWWTPPYSCDD